MQRSARTEALRVSAAQWSATEFVALFFPLSLLLLGIAVVCVVGFCLHSAAASATDESAADSTQRPEGGEQGRARARRKEHREEHKREDHCERLAHEQRAAAGVRTARSKQPNHKSTAHQHQKAARCGIDRAVCFDQSTVLLIAAENESPKLRSLGHALCSAAMDVLYNVSKQMSVRSAGRSPSIPAAAVQHCGRRAALDRIRCSSLAFLRASLAHTVHLLSSFSLVLQQSEGSEPRRYGGRYRARKEGQSPAHDDGAERSSSKHRAI